MTGDEAQGGGSGRENIAGEMRKMEFPPKSKKRADLEMG